MECAAHGVAKSETQLSNFAFHFSVGIVNIWVVGFSVWHPPGLACFQPRPAHGTTPGVLLPGQTITRRPHSTCILGSIRTHSDSAGKHDPEMNNWREFWGGHHATSGWTLVFSEHVEEGSQSPVVQEGWVMFTKTNLPRVRSLDSLTIHLPATALIPCFHDRCLSYNRIFNSQCFKIGKFFFT